MKSPFAVWPSTSFIHRRWFIQLAWSLFALYAIVLALAGLPQHFSQLQTICTREPCIAGQMTPAIAAYWLAGGSTLQDGAYIYLVEQLLVSVVILSLAAILIWQKPAHRLAVLAAFVWTALAATYPGSTAVLVHANAVFWLPVQLLAFVQWVGLLPLLWLLPDGRFKPAWLRWLAFIWVGVNLFRFAPILVAWVAPGIRSDWGYKALLIAGVVTVACSLFYRFRSLQTVIERQQLKWIGFGLASVIAWRLLWTGLLYFYPTSELGGVPGGYWTGLSYSIEMMVNIGCFGCIAAAILHFQLLDIDVAINRTLVYGALTLFVVITYIVLVNGIGSVVTDWLGIHLLTKENNPVARPFALLATGFIAIAFQPMRQWLQRQVNHLMYGQRDEPLTVLTHLGERLESSPTPAALLPTLAATIAQALKLPHVIIALRQGGAMITVAEFSDLVTNDKVMAPPPVAWSAGQLVSFPLIHQSETIGELQVAPRGPQERLSVGERALLTSIAQQAGAAVRAVQLTADLQRSRQQLVAAIEEERRRLRRDLHDGLGPVLAALTLESETARDLVRHDPAEAEALMAAVADQAEAATHEIRRLIYNLRPPALDDLGLVGALRSHIDRYVGSGVQFHLDTPPILAPLPAAVEVAAYRIACEAMTNVVRHAGATHCWVTLAIADTLVVTIVDDGQGMPTPLLVGVGVLAMRERSAEVGGVLTMRAADQASGQGLRIDVSMPIQSESEESP